MVTGLLSVLLQTCKPSQAGWYSPYNVCIYQMSLNKSIKSIKPSYDQCTATYEWSYFMNSTGFIRNKTCRNQLKHGRNKTIACGSKLLKQVSTQHGPAFMPLKMYPYSSIKDNIQYILESDSILEQCQEWKMRDVPPDSLADIFMIDWCI